MKPITVCMGMFLVCTMILSSVFAQTDGVMQTSKIQDQSESNDIAGKGKADATKCTFQADYSSDRVYRVNVQLKVVGEVIDDKNQRDKITASSNLAYEEKLESFAADRQNIFRSVRYYQQAKAEGKVGDSPLDADLRTERNLIVAEAGVKKLLLFSPRGSLTRRELELIETQGDSLLLDKLLPDRPVAVGDTWTPSEELMAQFLGLDEVGKTDVQCTLKQVDDKVARFEMKGGVSGAIYGVNSEVQVQARYRFDLRLKRVDWLGMLIKEQRSSSMVTDGLDVSAQVQTYLEPLEKSENLSTEELKDPPVQSSSERLLLSHVSKRGGWEVTYDRRWHVYRDLQDTLVLRMVDKGDLVAQCNCSSLSKKNPDKLVSLEDYQEEIKKALGDQFQELIDASQSVDEAGHRVLRVSARGTAKDLHILWTYYHIADKTGRQAAFVFTREEDEKFTERFGHADLELVESLKFSE